MFSIRNAMIIRQSFLASMGVINKALNVRLFGLEIIKPIR